MLNIRRAKASDAVNIALLGRITYTESHGHYVENKENLLKFYDEYYSVTKIREELKDETNLFWIIFSNELPIGFAKISLNVGYQNLEKKDSCKLQRIYILNDFIGLKLGSKMFEIILKKATDLSFKNIWLTVYHKNKKGINFYNKYQFIKIGSIDFYVGNTNYENLVFNKIL